MGKKCPTAPKNLRRGDRCARCGGLIERGECPDCESPLIEAPTDRHWNGRSFDQERERRSRED